MEYSIKDIADKVGVSKTAVNKKIANLGLQTKLVKNGNRFVVDENTAKQIIQAFSESDNQTKTQTEFANQNDNQFAKVIEILQSELESKNKQIEDLTRALEHTTASLNAEQALHAGTMQKQLTDKSSSSEGQVIESKGKRKWWQIWK